MVFEAASLRLELTQRAFFRGNLDMFGELVERYGTLLTKANLNGAAFSHRDSAVAESVSRSHVHGRVKLFGLGEHVTRTALESHFLLDFSDGGFGFCNFTIYLDFDAIRDSTAFASRLVNDDAATGDGADFFGTEGKVLARFHRTNLARTCSHCHGFSYAGI